MIRVHDWSVQMLGDAQALRSWRPEIHYGWDDQGAAEVSFSRPEFRDAVIFQPLHWWNEFQLKANMDPDHPNIHPGDMMLHFAGFSDKTPTMGPWLDKVENEANVWTVPLENTSYLANIKEYWDTHIPAREVRGRAQSQISSESSTVEEKWSMGNVSERLREIMWNSCEEYESIRNQADMLADLVNEIEERNR